MKKNYSEDIVPPSRRKSIKDIPLPPRSNSNSEQGNSIGVVPPDSINVDSFHSTGMNDVVIPVQSNDSIPEPDTTYEEEDFPIHNSMERKSRKSLFISLGTILILFAIFSIMSAFDSAEVEVEPKLAEASINESILIENISSKSSSQSLGYRVIELSQEVEKKVAATDEEYVSQKSSGMITIYNSYSSSPQKLIANTRFESPSGKIYRIQESVSVPGYTEKDGGLIPGSIDVEVFADQAGEEYDVSSAKFTIPGFAGQEPYDYFSAETKTSISGGYDGVRKIISEDSIEKAKSDLSTNLTSKLIDEIGNQVTEEFIAIYNTGSFTFGEVEQEDVVGSDEALLKRKGTIKAYVFDQIELSNAIARSQIAEYRDGQDVLIKDLNAMELKISINEGDSEIDGDEKEMMNVSGNAEFVWQIDEDEVKEKLVGTIKKNLYKTLQSFDGIIGAKASIKPFWKRSFPKTTGDINVIILE